MVAYTKPQQRKKEESRRLRGERDQMKFIYLRLGAHKERVYACIQVRESQIEENDEEWR